MRIIRDTREKEGYNFNFHDVELINRKLKCGDYKLESSDDIIFERKASTMELYINLAYKKEKDRLYREFDKLVEYKRPIFLFEFPESFLYDFPENSTIPKSKWKGLRMPSWRLRERLDELMKAFPKVKLVFCENKLQAEDFVFNTFKDHIDGRTKKFNF